MGPREEYSQGSLRRQREMRSKRPTGAWAHLTLRGGRLAFGHHAPARHGPVPRASSARRIVATAQWDRSPHRLSVDTFHASRRDLTHHLLQAPLLSPISSSRRISVAAARTNIHGRNGQGRTLNPRSPPPLDPMAALQRLLRAAASGGAVTAAARRRMGSLAAEQAPPVAPAPKGFPFAAEERMRRRPAAERNVQWVFLGCPGVGKGTYASRLSRLLGVPHIATGDLVRDELASTGPLAAQVRPSGLSVSQRVPISLFFAALI
jgi:hypothetical protein